MRGKGPKTPTKQPHGQLRQSQLITTFGPGAMLDLPNAAVLISGLEGWGRPQGQAIEEPRLKSKVETLLGKRNLAFYPPPPAEDDEYGPRTGVTAYKFPEWFIANAPDRERLKRGVRSRPLVHLRALERGKYHYQGQKVPVTPIRFVQACPAGHLSDIDWPGLVHRGDRCGGELFLDETGTTGDVSDIVIRCSCGKDLKLIQLVKKSEDDPHGPNLGACLGRQPWLGSNSREECKLSNGKHGVNRLLIRQASNAYFPQILSVISIPEGNPDLRHAVDQLWEAHLRYAESLEELVKERKRDHIQRVLGDLTNEEVWAEIKRRHGPADALSEKPIKQAEIETLLRSPASYGDDRPDGDFFARALPPEPTPDPRFTAMDKVVLVHRLREVKAMVGFTRLEASVADADGELSLSVQRAPIARDLNWVPAVEHRGEGIFLGFDTDRIKAWENSPAVQARAAILEAGHARWCALKGHQDARMPSMAYWMLHGLSHLLITAVALECGYHSSSIRERVYAGEGGYGILLHTGTADSEGTLGGLVEVGRHIRDHLRLALENGRLCSNDPVCAQHDPLSHEERHLHGAACHGCLLIAETSCEQFNAFLDRSLIIPTVEALDAAFFQF